MLRRKGKQLRVRWKVSRSVSTRNSEWVVVCVWLEFGLIGWPLTCLFFFFFYFLNFNFGSFIHKRLLFSRTRCQNNKNIPEPDYIISIKVTIKMWLVIDLNFINPSIVGLLSSIWPTNIWWWYWVFYLNNVDNHKFIKKKFTQKRDKVKIWIREKKTLLTWTYIIIYKIGIRTPDISYLEK